MNRRLATVALAFLLGGCMAPNPGENAAPGDGRLLVSQISGVPGNEMSLMPSVNHDGSMVAFVTQAWNLLGDSATECGRPQHGLSFACANVVVHSAAEGIVARSENASGALGNRRTLDVALADHAPVLSFRSWASNYVPAGSNGMIDVFVLDLEGGGGVRRISNAYDGSEAAGPTSCRSFCGPASISGDGRFVVFGSWAENLIEDDDNEVPDFFLVDVANRTTELVSLALDGGLADGASYLLYRGPAVSSDGSVVTFMSTATNLVEEQVPRCTPPEEVDPRTAPACPQVYLRNRTSGTTILLSKDATAAPGTRVSQNPQVSADGSLVAFLTEAPNLIGDSQSVQAQLVAVRGPSWEPVLLSADPAGRPADAPVGRFSLAADGSRAAFLSRAGNLGAPKDGNDKIFVYDFGRGVLYSIEPSLPGSGSRADVHDVALSGDGRKIAVATNSDHIVEGLPDGLPHQVYLMDVDTLIRESADSRDEGWAAYSGSLTASPET